MSVTHQEAIAKCVTAILALDEEIVTEFRRGNPFDKLIRSFDEFTADGKPLYRNKRGSNHYKMSVAAKTSGLTADKLYGEHRIPVSVIIRRLLDSDRSYESIYKILKEGEVVLITEGEAKLLDRRVSNGGSGLRNRMPESGLCRLDEAGIMIDSSTLTNQL
ncbi:hypothetical protein HNQ93_001734 [Hymenobacter luteus]|uniref:Uncharacterized protein n=2 Tax=Hymenobacter TaxID=89966 RepID=A0A7W9T0M5_9BACT|nr:MULTISPECIES: hypothetical protein [Hymenobacter]MBB4600905.1 hypothetical protein [Hymenobacter latericoloratus]MBB6058888.1 hypothetical protein [Hymenobacter luteus]